MYRVMLVDDEDRIRSGLKHVINWSDHGFVICGEAENGKKALALIQKLSPDLLLTDIKMPIMDGLELLFNMSNSYPHIRMVILSGYNDFTFVKTALKHKAVDYLLKPVDEEELILLLQKARIEMDLENKKKNEKSDGLSSVSAILVDTHTVSNKAVAVTLAYIDSHYAENITLKQASTIAYICHSYLGKLFKESTGETFHDYLNKVRIEKAKEMLKKTDCLIYEICKNVGYDSPDYFRKQFRLITGLSPNEYKNEERR